MKNNDNDTELFDAKLDELLSELRSGTIMMKKYIIKEQPHD